ncbi:MAG: ABC transporter permease [Eubacteriales bacterium]|nr:ABC transporter permease [Eubacteriales bacterium]
MDVLNFIIQQTMYFSIPLLVVALGAMFSERSGIINIAMEGIMIMGAFTSIFFINISSKMGMAGQLQLVLAILIAAATGIIFSLFHAYASISMKADQTISGTALNMFAPAFAIFIARVIQGIQQVQFTNTFRITNETLANIPIIGAMFFDEAYITTYLGFIILIVSVFVLYKTKFGLRLRACGENPHAADAAGINVHKMQYAGVIISGALGGLGGLIFVVPTSVNFNADVSGYGFLAIAVLIFGQWNPVKILGASLFFGVMKAISASYSSIPLLAGLGISSYFYKMVPYIVTLIVLIFTSRNSRAPKAEGIPFDKGQR